MPIKICKRIIADTTLRISSYFSNPAKFWLNLQDDHDIEEEKNANEEIFNKIKSITED